MKWGADTLVSRYTSHLPAETPHAVYIETNGLEIEDFVVNKSLKGMEWAQ